MTDTQVRPVTGDTTARAARTAAVAAARGSLAMAFVGGCVAESAHLDDAPLLTAQALRYAVACVLLLAWARLRGRRVHRPVGVEWLWLSGVAAIGLVLFNIALVRGSAHAEPAVLAVAVASVPIVLGVLGPLLENSRHSSPTPRRVPARVLLAAAVVTAGAVLVQEFGSSDALGLAWAFLVLACEAGFTLLAVPVLRRHSPLGVSVWTTAIAAAVFAAGGLGVEGPTAALRLTPTHLIATAYLAVAVTAVAFVLWYGAVQRLGAARAGLLTGIAPISAAVVGAVLAGQWPASAVWPGLVLVASGLAMGLQRGDATRASLTTARQGRRRPSR